MVSFLLKVSSKYHILVPQPPGYTPIRNTKVSLDAHFFARHLTLLTLFSIFYAVRVNCQKPQRSDTQICVLAILAYLEAKLEKFIL